MVLIEDLRLTSIFLGGGSMGALAYPTCQHGCGPTLPPQPCTRPQINQGHNELVMYVQALGGVQALGNVLVWLPSCTRIVNIALHYR